MAAHGLIDNHILYTDVPIPLGSIARTVSRDGDHGSEYLPVTELSETICKLQFHIIKVVDVITVVVVDIIRFLVVQLLVPPQSRSTSPSS